jgi:hypothetical protein
MHFRSPRTLFLLLVITFTVLTLFSEGHFASGQSSEMLKLDRPVTTEIAPGGKREFTLPLKEGDFAEVFWLANDELRLSVTVYGPGGTEVPSGPDEPDNSVAFVAQEAGDYKVSLSLGESDGVVGPQQVTLQYRDKTQLPAGTPQIDRRLINGYDVKIRRWEEQSVLTVEKGRVKLFMRGGGGVGGFHFMDDLTQAYDASDKRSAAMIKATPDKTSDGNPDVAVSYYSGGAHCCFTAYFIELGEKVKVAADVDGGNVPVNAVGRATGGGLRLETADNTFAYWLVSFAESPLPSITLEFHGGYLRPAPDAMRKPAPPLPKLQQEARSMRSQLSLEPYKGETESGFEVAFWGRMLDLLYSGNEALAWQYLDLVWPVKKPGKALFRADFERQLSDSWFWSATHPKK